MKKENKNIARIFLFCRESLGISQRKMAILLEVNQSTISRIEKGDFFPTQPLIEKLESKMKLDLGQLIRKAIQSIA